MKSMKGFTLIEVLIALAIIAIALTALLKASAENVSSTHHLKQKMLGHWVAMQGVQLIQLNLIPVQLNQEVTEVTKIFGEPWYWRAKISSTPINHTQQITISLSPNQNGPFNEALIAYRRSR